MNSFNLKSFILGIVLTTVSISSVQLLLSKSKNQSFQMVVSDKELPCINTMLTRFGKMINKRTVSYPEYLTGLNLLEVTLNDSTHDANFAFGACFSDGYFDTQVGDPHLWDTIREFGDKRGKDVFITNKYGSDNLRIYYIDK